MTILSLGYKRHYGFCLGHLLSRVIHSGGRQLPVKQPYGKFQVARPAASRHVDESSCKWVLQSQPSL